MANWYRWSRAESVIQIPGAEHAGSAPANQSRAMRCGRREQESAECWHGDVILAQRGCSLTHCSIITYKWSWQNRWLCPTMIHTQIGVLFTSRKKCRLIMYVRGRDVGGFLKSFMTISQKHDPWHTFLSFEADRYLIHIYLALKYLCHIWWHLILLSVLQILFTLTVILVMYRVQMSSL